MTKKKTRRGKPILALHSRTGAIKEFKSIQGACDYLKETQGSACRPSELKKSCRDCSGEFRGYYWSLIE